MGLFVLRQGVCLGYSERAGCPGRAVTASDRPSGLLKSIRATAAVPWSCSRELKRELQLENSSYTSGRQSEVEEIFFFLWED